MFQNSLRVVQFRANDSVEKLVLFQMDDDRRWLSPWLVQKDSWGAKMGDGFSKLLTN